MDFFKSIYSYFTENYEEELSTELKDLEITDFDIELKKHDKQEHKIQYKKIKELINSDKIITSYNPPDIYNENGILNIKKTKIAYKKYINDYYNISEYNIKDSYEKFYNVDNLVLEHNSI